LEGRKEEMERTEEREREVEREGDSIHIERERRRELTPLHTRATASGD
jgi:hypothetical protein